MWPFGTVAERIESVGVRRAAVSVVLKSGLNPEHLSLQLGACVKITFVIFSRTETATPERDIEMKIDASNSRKTSTSEL